VFYTDPKAIGEVIVGKEAGQKADGGGKILGEGAAIPSPPANGFAVQWFSLFSAYGFY